MPKKREDITLYGDAAEEFRETRQRLEERWGFEPSKSQVVAYMMGEADL